MEYIEVKSVFGELISILNKYVSVHLGGGRGGPIIVSVLSMLYMYRVTIRRSIVGEARGDVRYD